MPSNSRTHEEGAVRPLTKHQIAYAERRARGEGKRDARLDRLPQVQRHIQDIRERAAATAAYDVSQCMDECNAAIAFARQNRNAMAMMKGLELKAKLAGLLIERIHVEAVDLTKALAEAKERAAQRVKLVNVPPVQELLEHHDQAVEAQHACA